VSTNIRICPFVPMLARNLSVKPASGKCRRFHLMRQFVAMATAAIGDYLPAQQFHQFRLGLAPVFVSLVAVSVAKLVDLVSADSDPHQRMDPLTLS
jgi:hypothetical protein